MATVTIRIHNLNLPNTVVCVTRVGLPNCRWRYRRGDRRDRIHQVAVMSLCHPAAPPSDLLWPRPWGGSSSKLNIILSKLLHFDWCLPASRDNELRWFGHHSSYRLHPSVVMVYLTGHPFHFLVIFHLPSTMPQQYLTCDLFQSDTPFII